MSDSVKKYFELVEEGKIKETNLPPPDINNYIISEGTKSEAYSILVNHTEEAILEAARILKSGK